MPNIESINLRINKLLRHSFIGIRKRKIKKEKFSIISNNCWGGMIYESYGLEKQSPTVGLFFLPKEYIKFISNFKYYLGQNLRFIKFDNSKNKSILNKLKINNNVLIGVLDDIEIVFLHYQNEKIAKEKWYRRIDRINYNNIIFKFNDQNGCQKEDVENFLRLPYKNKIFFTVKDWKINNNNIIRIPQILNNKNIYASNEPFGKNIIFNVNKYINCIEKEDYFDDK